MKKFEDTDIFVNTIKTHPKVKLFCYNGKIYINNTNETNIKLNDFLPEPPPPPEIPEPPVEELTFTADPPSLVFISSGTISEVDITAAGTGTESFTVSSDNINFFVFPDSGIISAGGTVTIDITFIGSDSLQFGTITFSGETNSVEIPVDSSGYIGGGPIGGGGGLFPP